MVLRSYLLKLIMIINIIDKGDKNDTLPLMITILTNERYFMYIIETKPRPKFATDVLSAALSGGVGEMEDYFDESQFIQEFLDETSPAS